MLRIGSSHPKSGLNTTFRRSLYAHVACGMHYFSVFWLATRNRRFRLPGPMENSVKGSVKSFFAAVMLAFSTCGHAGLADPLFVSSDGHVTLNYLGYEAGYTNTLWLHSP